jgi:hypothetical protein
VGVLILLLAACGPSPEQAATTTIPAPTSVPPTAIPSPTPVPYDLTVTVVDEQGNPISWAQIAIVELNQSVTVDESGQASWKDLSQGNITLRVTAQGYSTGEQQFALDRGLTEASIALVHEPYGLLPSQACAVNETLLYAEDFQDGAVEDWGTYPPGIAIPIEADPDVPENKVLLLNFGGTDGEFQVNTVPIQDNVVRRLKYKPGDHSRFSVGLGKGNDSYFVVLSGDEISLNYYSEATGEQKLARGNPIMSQGVWHLLEYSSYNGKIEVWADGTLVASADEVSLPTEGRILGIGSAYLPPDSLIRIDDISICELNAPFESLPAALPTP